MGSLCSTDQTTAEYMAFSTVGQPLSFGCFRGRGTARSDGGYVYDAPLLQIILSPENGILTGRTVYQPSSDIPKVTHGVLEGKWNGQAGSCTWIETWCNSRFEYKGAYKNGRLTGRWCRQQQGSVDSANRGSFDYSLTAVPGFQDWNPNKPTTLSTIFISNVELKGSGQCIAANGRVYDAPVMQIRLGVGGKFEGFSSYLASGLDVKAAPHCPLAGNWNIDSSGIGAMDWREAYQGHVYAYQGTFIGDRVMGTWCITDAQVGTHNRGNFVYAFNRVTVG